MPDPENKAMNEAVQAVYKYAAELMKAGLSNSQVESKLIEKGISQEIASIVVKKLSEIRLEAAKEAANKNMLYGALWCIGGSIVTAISYSGATGGGTYVVAWGAIFWGAIQFLKGLVEYIKYSSSVPTGSKIQVQEKQNNNNYTSPVPENSKIQVQEKQNKKFGRWIILAIILLVFGICIGLFVKDFLFPEIIVPTPTITPQPTFTPHPPPTVLVIATPSFACLKWDEVRTSDIGKEICVYGNVYDARFVGESTFQIQFSSNRESIFLAAGTHYYVLHLGECIAAKGKVLRSGEGVPYINIDKALYECESWMK